MSQRSQSGPPSPLSFSYDSLLREVGLPDLLEQLQVRLSKDPASSGASAHAVVMRFVLRTVPECHRPQLQRMAREAFGLGLSAASLAGDAASDAGGPWAPLTPQRTSCSYHSDQRKEFIPSSPDLSAKGIQDSVNADLTRRLGAIPCDLEAEWAPRLRPKPHGGVRLLQWNILADGLAEDGFCVPPVSEDWPYGRDCLPTTDEDPVPIAEMLQEMLSITREAKEKCRAVEKQGLSPDERSEVLGQIQIDKFTELAKFKRKYDTVQSQANVARCVDWENRVRRMQWLVARSDPDVITLQEVDRLADVKRLLEQLGYTCSSRRAEYRPLLVHYGHPEYLQACRGSRVAFAPKVASEALCQKILRSGEADDYALRGACQSMMGAAFGQKPLHTLKSWLRQPEFREKGGYSKLLSLLQLEGHPDIDDDGCVVFWKADRFDCVRIEYLGFGGQENVSQGAVKVLLREHSSGKYLWIATTHLASGSGATQEESRIQQLRGQRMCTDSEDRDGGLMEWLRTGGSADPVDMSGGCRPSKRAPVILGMDANSRPAFKADRTVWKTFKAAGYRSVWDSSFDPAGQPTSSVQPVSVNKVRGPGSGQAGKIGEHAVELIDHVFFSEDVRFRGHGLEPRGFEGSVSALGCLLPSLACPSDHYPVIADFGL
eukprot:TRINITY_DN5895_c0_g2_i1.p1 TRINITY_DN5895_c0_g2~~TRINITY_DN5895_c0_g2_i1.p1  ORF type:complete len:657 (+),score=138.23 TRINITY_DN5895_c0_g2_i1:74-2044(+)